MIEDECDIWVVKCPFSSKTDRVATQQSCALDYPEVARTISLAVWRTKGSTKTASRQIRSSKPPPPPPERELRAGTSGDLAAQDPRLAGAIGDDIGLYLPPHQPAQNPETRHRPLTISALKQRRCRRRWRSAGRYAAHKRATLAGEAWVAC